MVVIEVDDTIHDIEKKLGGLAHKAPKVLAKSINDTAAWAQRELRKEAQKTYTVRAAGFKQSMKIKRANYSHLESIIYSKGQTIDLYRFDHSKDGSKARVLKSSTKKALEKGGIKAFVTKFANGHMAIVQRVYKTDKDNPDWINASKEKRKKLHGLPIVAKYSNSAPIMLGNEKQVYGIVEPKIEDKLTEQIEKHIKKVLEGYE